MGKHERQLIKEAEKIIVKVLNSRSLNTSDKKNRWLNHAFTMAEKISNDFKNISSARHLGNRYDNTGDISIISNSDKFFIEVKMSDTKLGVGTKANISQDALTDNHFFKGKVKSWSKFRQEKNHDKWVNSSLNQYRRYPRRILKIANPITQKEEKARFLRDLANKGNKKAKSILSNIREKDRKEKIEYLAYLNSQEQQNEMIKRFFILITLGIHIKEVLGDLIRKDNFFREIQNLFVYYANYHRGKIVIRQEDAGEKIRKILKRYSDFKIIFLKGLTHCKIVGIKNKIPEPLLQIVLHWKNIAQGIKTPCLNIFDLTVNI